ncbi:MAG: hypothetical protein K2P17_08150 [Helicobacteraceae bacterium]|nr:hypothetical protein [Helicobacteraceae bacterium]
MRLILIFLLMVGIYATESNTQNTESTRTLNKNSNLNTINHNNSTDSTSQEEIDSKNSKGDSIVKDLENEAKNSESSEVTNEAKVESKKDSKSLKELFIPAVVVEDSFGSFVVGYQMLFKNRTEHKHGIFFALDRGWLVWSDILFVGMSLDGTAGSFYSINLNVKTGARLMEGRLSPSISFGYGLFNHNQIDLQTNKEIQYNLHGANATLSLFVDIFRGIGIEFSYRVGLHPFHTIKKTDITRNIQSFMINLKFIDFSI